MTITAITDSLASGAPLHGRVDGGVWMETTSLVRLHSDGSDFGTTAAEAWAAVDAQTGGLLPDYGAVLDATNFPNLMMDHLDVTAIDPANVDVTVHYGRYNTSLNGGIDNSPVIYSPLQSLKQINTERDPDGNAITVSYTGSEGQGPQTQWGEISVLDSEVGFSLDIAITTEQPTTIMTLWGNAVNSAIWNGYGPGTWLCRRCTFRPLSVVAGSNKHAFTFEFVHDHSGWQPWVFWRDAHSGRSPSDLTLDTGYKEIPWHLAIDFGVEPANWPGDDNPPPGE